MQLLDDWDQIIKRAWSFKFSIAAALFGALEVAVQYITPVTLPSGVFAGIAALISILAAGSRLLQQQELSGAKDGADNQST